MKSPAFQFYPKDILTSQRVALMSLEEEGAYRRAIDFCWLHGHIPADAKQLSKLIGKGCTPRIARKGIEMFVNMPDDNSKLIHERLEVERKKQREFSNKRTKVANIRWSKEKKIKIVPAENNASASSKEMQVHSISNALHLHSSSANIHQQHQTAHEDFSNRLLVKEGSLDRKNLEISTKTKITGQILHEFLAH